MENKGALLCTCVCALISTLASAQYGGRLSNHFYFQSRAGVNANVSTSNRDSGPSRSSSYYTDPFLLSLLNRPSYLAGKANDRQQETNINNGNPATTTVPTTTATRNTNFINIDGSVNRNRPGFLPYPTEPEQQNRDRDTQVREVDLWLLQYFGRPSFLQNYQKRYRSNNGNEVTLSPTNPRPQGTTSRPGAVVIDDKGTVFVNREPQVQDKPFYIDGHNPFSTTTRKPTSTTTRVRTNKPNSPNRFNSNIMYAMSTALQRGDVKTARSFLLSRRRRDIRRRSTDGQARLSLYPAVDTTKVGAGNVRDEFMAGGISCYDPFKFPACQYYPRCFANLPKSCVSRGSFIGDDVLRWCGRTIDVIESTESETLKKYLKGVDECVDYKLSEVLEYPSCDDVTLKLGESLLEKNQSSCLFQQGVFCQILEEPLARFTLAEMFSKPIQDADFMMRLLVSLGDMTSFCRGPGANIFVTDLMSKVVTPDSPFDIPDPPIPGLSL